MRLAGIAAIPFLTAALAFPKEKVQPPPPAPLPDRVLQAKIIFLSSQGDKVVYDEAYKRLQEWGRFQLVGDPEKADVIFVVSKDYAYRTPRLRDLVIWYPYPPYLQAQSLVILEPKTKVELWSDLQIQRPALKAKNREKESILAVDALIQRLRERIPAHPRNP